MTQLNAKIEIGNIVNKAKSTHMKSYKSHTCLVKIDELLKEKIIYIIKILIFNDKWQIETIDFRYRSH